MTNRQSILFAITMALRKIPRGILRDLAKPRPLGDELPERFAAETILEHLKLSNYEVRQGLPRRPHSTGEEPARAAAEPEAPAAS